MRRPNAEHTARPWRVHALATDFELLDVWRFPVRIAPDVPFTAFLEYLARMQSELIRGRGLAAMLFRLRSALGRIFGWDEDRSEPAGASTRGRDAHSLRHRLDPKGFGASASVEVPAPGPSIGFDPVFTAEGENLFEIQNETVHALMHLGRVVLEGPGALDSRDWAPQMAIYVKPRGLLGRVYMAVISPFRHLVVYPAMMRTVERGWPIFAAERGWC